MSLYDRYNIWWFLAIFLVLIAVGKAKGQAPERLKFSHLTPEDGLSQSSVYTILQDREGYMWFATQDGLNKYNGYEFKVYSHDPEDPYSLSLNEIRALYEDKKGDLWVGTLGGGINLYDRKRDRFIRFKGDIERPQQTLSDNSIWAIYEDRRGNFWVGTSWGLNQMKREGAKDADYLSKVTHYIKQKDDPRSISSNNISDIYEDSRGNLWIGTEKGLNILNRETGEFRRFMHTPEDPGSIGANHITTIYEDKNGQLWIGTAGGGLNYYDYENERFHKYQHDEDDANSIASNTVYAVQEGSNGMLWVGTGNEGLSLFDRSSEKFYNYQYDETQPHGINNNSINSLYKSRDQTMWVGTFAGGINFVSKKSKKIEHYNNDPSSPSSLSHNAVRSFLETASGLFLVGTDGGGLNIFDRATGRFSVLKHDPGNPNSIPSNVILDMKEHRKEGHVWLGTYNGGVSLFDVENRTFRHYQHQPGNPQSLSSNEVFELYRGSEGRLWVGTNGGGISVLDPESGNFVRYMENTNDSTSLDNNDIRSIYEDSKGDIWIGSYGGRLTKFERGTGQFYFYDINVGSLYSSVIHCMHEDPGKGLWLGTRGGGLKLFDRETHEVVTYSEKDGLPSNIVNGILEDESGNLWISTNNGISKFNPDTETFINYGMEDGLQSQEFSPGAYYKDREGYMYFGGVNGFNRFHPDSVKMDRRVAPVVLTDFQLFNQSVSIGEDSPLEKHISQTDRLVLPHDASVFTFNYVALDYNALKDIRFAYKLEGFDESWNYVGKKRSATYTNLDPGQYTFKLKAANNDGVWGEKTNTVSVVITPPFWQTTWFYVTVVLVLAGLIFGGYRYRVRQITNRNKMLAQKVAERTSELDKKNRALQNALEDLKNTRSELVARAHKAGMAELATGVLHNVGNILNSVNVSTVMLRETVQNSKLRKFKKANELLKKHEDNLEEFLLNDPRGKKLFEYYLKLDEPLDREMEQLKKYTARLSEKVELIKEVIDAQQSYARLGGVNEKVQIERIVEDTLKLQSGSIERHGVEIQKDFGDTDDVIVQKSKVVHILVNFFKNAKESMENLPRRNKKITLRTWQEGDWVHLSVTDNGSGIKEEHIDKVFGHGFTTKDTGHGFGLHSCANYMSEMGGKIEVSSEGEGKGATFTLSFPKSHPVDSDDDLKGINSSESEEVQ